MDYLDRLENESIYIIREAYNQIKDVALLWSIGKDSTTLLWLIRKAFFGHIPFPIIHLDTGYKFKEIYQYRDAHEKEWDLDIIVHKNEEAIQKGVCPEKGKLECCTELKTNALKQIVKQKGFKALYLGIRRDEHGIRAKERYFSVRDEDFEWDYKGQAPELWGQYKTKTADEEHIKMCIRDRGYALNCPTNSYIMKKYGFKGFVAPPCVSDCGISIGIGLYAFYKHIGCNFNFKLENAFYGNQDNRVTEIVTEFPWEKHVKSFALMDMKQCVEDIINGPIVWFYGRAEIGPRALGNRSLLADPRNKDSKNKLNIIKKREWWRPVAPVILEEDIDDWFIDVYPSPFMLHTFKIKENKNELIPAVMHIDGSSRLQTVNKTQNAILYEVIRTFKEKTGIPILCNTSLNDKGEPIIDRIDEALNFALRKKIKVLYINGYRIELKNHDMYEETDCEKRFFNFMVYQNENERLYFLKRDNCLNLDKELISQYYHYPYAYEKYKLDDKNDMDIFRRVVSIYNNKIKNQIDVKRSN